MRYLIYSFTLVFILVSSTASAGSLKSKIKNFNNIGDGVSTSGSISNGGLEELKKQGFKTIIDLRTRAEGSIREKNKAMGLGLNYFNIPIAGADISDAQLSKFTKIFDVATKPILVHCASGNRVGAMLALYYVSKGMDTDRAFKKGRAVGMNATTEERIRANCDACE